MVVQTERDDTIWYQCEVCGLMLDDPTDAEKHEQNCNDDDPSYIQ